MKQKHLSTPLTGKWHPGQGKRVYGKLTCKGFHFPAFQGGRRKRTNNEVRKTS
jgi:hypothetical protein